MKRIALLLALGGAALAAPAQGQSGNGSDVTGPITTSGEIAGGAFRPAPGTVAAAASPAVSAAIGAAGATLAARLAGGTLDATTPSGASASVPAPVQASVLAVLTGTASSGTIRAAFDASGSPAAGELAQALEGLLSSPATGQLAEAIGFFNAVVGDAGPAFLAAPPAEMLAVHAVLSTLSDAARAGA